LRASDRLSSLSRVAASIVLGLAGCGGESDAEAVSVAVAANFLAAQEALASTFTATSGILVVSSAGSSGQLLAQIRNGAPFHVFLSADQERPRLLEEEGGAGEGSRFTYAEGRLVLWAPGNEAASATGAALLDAEGARVAVANPETAPYGAAAMAALAELGVLERVAPRIVQGESVAQAQGFVGSGAAELGFLGLSQVIAEPPATYWLVPPHLYPPILQDAVLLLAGQSHAGARAYLEFLKSPEARRVIEEHGYATSESVP
jgi:molybdate transport system substrate-binding protein